jgi:hypothetical protein
MLTRAKRKNKYNSKKVSIDGMTFDSKAESQYYLCLKAKEFKGQVPFELIPGYRDQSGKKIRSTHYIADFVVFYPDGSEDIVDVKGSRGFQTDIFKLKKKLFEWVYKKPIKIITVNGK